MPLADWLNWVRRCALDPWPQMNFLQFMLFGFKPLEKDEKGKSKHEGQKSRSLIF